jgi:hypothetical protein
MARILDYQFDAITTQADGTRIIDNAGTLGAANDVTMDTGQMLEFNGVNQSVTSTYFPTDMKTICATMKFNVSGFDEGCGCNDGAGHRAYVVKSAGDFLQIGFGSAFFVTTTSLTIGEIHRVIATINGANIDIYLDGAYITSFAGSFSGTSTTAFKLGGIGTGFAHNGLESNIQIWDASFSATDVTHDFNNPEWVYKNGTATEITPDAGSSLLVSNLKAWFLLTRGDGSNISELVGNTSHAIVNYASIMWTNADQQTEDVQDVLIKKDASGIPIGLADAGTLRFNV